MIKAVIFDVDGVLLDSADAIHAFFTELLTTFGYELPEREVFKTNFHKTMRDQIHVYTQAPEEKVEEIWQVARARGVDYNLIKTPEHSATIVSEISKKYPLGIVSNKLSENMWKGEHMASLKQYFQIALGADDVQNKKPHPEPLLLVAKKIGVLPEECVFIGDMESDFQAGRAAGMKVIMFGNESVEGADAYTSSFLELPALIKNL